MIKFSHYIAAIFCFLYGILSLLLVVGGGDGTWMLYSKEIANGSKIYTDLGINQQPLFYLFSILVLYFSGNIFLFQKLLYAPVLFLFVYSIYKISCEVEKDNGLRAIIILSMFFVAISFEAFRFDDYHPLASSFVLLSIYVAILYFNKKLTFDLFSLIQTIIFSLTFLTRINEGLAVLGVFLLTALYYLKFSKSFFILLIKLFFTFVAITSFFLYFLNENLSSWLHSTLISASGAKGGFGLFFYPIKIFINAILFLFSPKHLNIVSLLCFYIINFLIIRASKGYINSNFKNKVNIYFWFLYALVQILFFRVIYGNFLAQDLIPVVVISTYISVPAFFSCYFLLNFNFLNRFVPIFLLSAFTFLLFFFGSLSSGGHYGGLFFPFSTIIPLVAYLLFLTNKKSLKIFCYTILFFLAAQSFFIRFNNPYSWHSYSSESFYGVFDDYVKKYDDNNFIFFLPKNLFKLINPVCLAVPPNKTLLSLPFSFANYYCQIKPWHGFVQMFFDTSTSSRVDRLMMDLSLAPPDYIFYQRQLQNMSMHEEVFFGGKPLPFRMFDDLVEKKLQTGQWQLIYESYLYPPSHWMLIRTSN